MLSVPLRAYAFVFRSGTVDVSVHRDIGTVLTLWQEAAGSDPSASMLLHTGFDRPEVDTTGCVLTTWPGRVLLSEPTRWSLPASFGNSPSPVATISYGERALSLPIYLATSGWGYTAPAEQQQQTGPTTDVPAANVEEEWILTLKDRIPAAFDSVRALGIGTDRDYLEKRASIPVQVRDEVDDLRFECLLEAVDRSDPFVLLQIAPDWLLQFPLPELDDLTIRVRNALIKEGIETFSHLAQLSPEYVLSIENFGRRSYQTIAPTIITTAQRKPYRYLIYSRNRVLPAPRSSSRLEDPSPAIGPPTVREIAQDVQYRSLWDGLQATLADMPPRDRIVLEERLGREHAPKTLDDVGAMLRVTRERARQIEHRAMRDLLAKTWAFDLKNRLGQLFTGRAEPLFLDLIASEDEWFRNFDDCISFLGCLIERLNDGTYYTWRLNGRLIVVRIRESDWEALERTTRVALTAQIEAKLTPSDVSLFVEASAASAGCPELSGALAQGLWDNLHFARDSELGLDVLVGLGRSIRAAVAAIMAEADEPLDLRTVADRCAERLGEQPSDLAVRAALNGVGAFPFSGRRYALERHVAISDADIDEVVAALEQVFAEGPVGKQWHCSELVAAIQEQRPDLPPILDQYVVNIILRRSTVVNYLGRQVWALKISGAASTRDRLDVTDLMLAVLTRAGRPMTTAEVKAAISGIRGLNAIFPVFASEQIARLEPGVWGIVERDFGLSRGERGMLFAQIENILARRHKALHVSEIRLALQESGYSTPSFPTNEMIFGLCQTDPRFRIGHGQLLGLVPWVSMNRLTVRGAIRQAVREQGDTIHPERLYERVDHLTERRVERFVTHAELKILGFAADEQTGIWYSDKQEDDELAS